MSRYYSPALGRFISPDMAEDGLILPQSLNRYGYAGGDPIDLRDANGEWPQCDGLGGGGGHGGGGGGGNGPPTLHNPSGKPPLTETLGLPPGTNLYQPFSLGGLILGPRAYPGCDFGACQSVFGMDDAAEISLCIVQPEICAVALGVGAVLVYIYTHPPPNIHFSKPDIRIFNDAVKEYERQCGVTLSEDDKTKLHDELKKHWKLPGGPDPDFHDIVEAAKSLFGCPNPLVK